MPGMYDGRRPQPSARARTLALSAVLLAIVVVAYFALSSGSSYSVRVLFSDASGLVTGDQVMIGPSSVGSVQSIKLTSDGQAAVVIDLEGDAAPLYKGTVARIEENGLAGIASHYITLQPAAGDHHTIHSGGTIPQDDTYAEVGLDQLFDTLNGPTRTGLRNIIRGEATSIRGKTKQARATLTYLDPLLQSTSEVTGALSRDEPAFDGLLVQGAQTMQRLATRSQQLTDLVGKADAVTGAVAQQATALQESLELLPTALNKSTTTFAGLRQTIGVLGELVAATKPQVRQLEPFAVALRQLAQTATPRLEQITALIASPKGNDLTTLLQSLPGLEKTAATGFPNILASLTAQESSGQLPALREYTPDIVAALANVGQIDGYYDANGHYTRAEPFYGAYGISGGMLIDRNPAARYNGLTVSRTGRCPGAATQPADASMPEKVAGCNSSNTPAGP
jgi:phospholipid/cholesterol/gamma-HCH transport system substrate-binding protein